MNFTDKKENLIQSTDKFHKDSTDNLDQRKSSYNDNTNNSFQQSEKPKSFYKQAEFELPINTNQKSSREGLSDKIQDDFINNV